MEDEEDVDQQMVANATAVLKTGDALLHALRTYSESHPALDRFRDKLESQLATYFSRDEELTFALDARSLLVEGVEVQTAERVDTNIWFPLFAAGIRELTFFQGIDSAELTRLFKLLQHLKEMPATEEGEDDAVTLLWQAELENVDFYAVDGFTSGEGGARRLSTMREMVEANMSKDPREVFAQDRPKQRSRRISMSKADVEALKNENLSALDDLPADTTTADMLDLQGPQLAQFATACAQEPTVVERYVDALLAALETAGADGDKILEQLRELFTAIVEDGRYVRARRMIEQVLYAARNREAFRAGWQDEIERKVIAVETVGALVRAVPTGSAEDVAEILPLLSRLSGWAAAPVIAALPTIEDDRRRGEVGEIAARWGADTQRAILEVLPTLDSEPMALELVRLSIRVEGDGVIATLKSALESRFTDVRANALRALTRRAEPAEADAAAIAAAADADPTVRHLALEHIIQYRPPAAARVVRRLVDRLDDTSDPEEMRQVYMAYAAVGGQTAVEFLLDKLRQRSLLGKSGATEEREAAAAALGLIRCQEARDDLEKIARSRLSRRTLRDMCTDALQNLDRRAKRPTERPRGRWSSSPPFDDSTSQAVTGRVAFRPSSAPPPARGGTTGAPPGARPRPTSGAPRPGEPMITFHQTSAPPSGQASEQPVALPPPPRTPRPTGPPEPQVPTPPVQRRRRQHAQMSPPLGDPTPFPPLEQPPFAQSPPEPAPPEEWAPTPSQMRRRIAMRPSQPPRPAPRPTPRPSPSVTGPPPPPPRGGKSPSLEMMLSEYLNPGSTRPPPPAAAPPAPPPPTAPAPAPEPEPEPEPDDIDDMLATYLSEND